MNEREGGERRAEVTGRRSGLRRREIRPTSGDRAPWPVCQGARVAAGRGNWSGRHPVARVDDHTSVVPAELVGVGGVESLVRVDPPDAEVEVVAAASGAVALLEPDPDRVGEVLRVAG